MLSPWNWKQARKSILTTSIQHFSWGPKQCSNAKKRKKEREKYEKEKTKILPIYIWYNYLYRKYKEFIWLLQLLSEFNKVTGYQYRSNTKPSCFSKFQQRIIRKWNLKPSLHNNNNNKNLVLWCTVRQQNTIKQYKGAADDGTACMNLQSIRMSKKNHTKLQTLSV